MFNIPNNTTKTMTCSSITTLAYIGIMYYMQENMYKKVGRVIGVMMCSTCIGFNLIGGALLPEEIAASTLKDSQQIILSFVLRLLCANSGLCGFGMWLIGQGLQVLSLKLFGDGSSNIIYLMLNLCSIAVKYDQTDFIGQELNKKHAANGYITQHIILCSILPFVLYIGINQLFAVLKFKSLISSTLFEAPLKKALECCFTFVVLLLHCYGQIRIGAYLNAHSDIRTQTYPVLESSKFQSFLKACCFAAPLLLCKEMCEFRFGNIYLSIKSCAIYTIAAPVIVHCVVEFVFPLINKSLGHIMD